MELNTSPTSQDYILGNTTAEEQITFIQDQIQDPFDSSHTNYFKKLCGMVTSSDTLDQYCSQLLDEIENVYPGLDFDLGDYDSRLTEFFATIYKFFVKNIDRLMFVFLSQYILSNKNRKNLIAEYLDMKLPAYPKEQYGKKEYYILMTKLSSIIKDIRRERLDLSDMLRYIKKSDNCPGYVHRLSEYLSQDLVIDQDVVRNIFDMMFESDVYDDIFCKLQMFITDALINPYMEENGLEFMRLPPMEPDDTDISDDEENEDDAEIEERVE